MKYLLIIMQGDEVKKNSQIPISTKYSRVKDHLDFFLGQALEDIYAPLTMEQIKDRLRNETDINLGIKTIQKSLQKISLKYGENLLCQVGDRFRLNHCLYKYLNLKPPKGYPKD